MASDGDSDPTTMMRATITATSYSSSNLATNRKSRQTGHYENWWLWYLIYLSRKLQCPTKVERKPLFVADAEPSYFMQYCCRWLLPALLLQGTGPTSVELPRFDCLYSELDNLSTIGSPGEKSLCAEVFMGLHCSVYCQPHSISCPCASDSVMPFFSQDTVAKALQTVVDGFLEMKDYRTSFGVIDKINIFRPVYSRIML